MKKLFRKVQFASNIAIIAIAFLPGLLVIKEYFFSGTPAATASRQPQPPNVTNSQKQPDTVNPLGKTITLEDVDWAKNKRTFVLYLSTNCRYCHESSPFYQVLAKQAAAKNVSLVAVFPQDIDEAKNYLKGKNIDIANVVNSSLNGIGVVATPTLMVVNEKGIVSEYWR